jgi:ribosomal protein S27AE
MYILANKSNKKFIMKQLNGERDICGRCGYPKSKATGRCSRCG